MTITQQASQKDIHRDAIVQRPLKGAAPLGPWGRNWRFHHPLTEDQLAYADVQGRVADVGFYHGGDELYHLEGIPGIWHEACLERATSEEEILR